MKLQTPVDPERLTGGISYKDSIAVLGSCFADNIGEKMKESGFDVCVNPFGTLYNPVSLSNAAARLFSGVPFTGDECVEMGANAGKICSFSHHTSFARDTEVEFLENANASLSEASAFWKRCSKVIITLGTAWCFRFNETGETVANCLKRPAAEFTRYRLDVQSVKGILSRMVGRNPDKEFIFTVSPVRHLADGAHGNQISKSTLLLAVDSICRENPSQCEYFPAYEIVMDELRDYRFYAEDMVHPSAQAVGYIWERFLSAALPDEERVTYDAKMKLFKASRHRNNLL